ncbi:MAG: type II secretion system F family protein, partial [bacterium]
MLDTDIGLWTTEAGPPAAAAAPAPRGAAPADDGPLRRALRALVASRGRVKAGAVVVLIRHLATLLAAGLQLSKALRTVARQMADTPLSAVVIELAEAVESGQMLSSAMASRPDVFDSLTINVVRAGEAGGTLAETLGELADDLEEKQALRRSVVGALVYPAIVLLIAAGVIAVVLVYVVPVFRDIYTKMKLDLPWITRVLLATSGVVVEGWWALGLGAVGAALGWRHARRRESVRRWCDRLVLQVPVVGRLRRTTMAARFFGAFATLIASGVSIVETLRLLSRLTGNTQMADAVDAVREHVSRGGRFSELLESYP